MEPVVHVDFFKSYVESRQSDTDVLIFMCSSGSCQIDAMNHSFLMKPDDLILINPSEEYVIRGLNGLLIRLSISTAVLMEKLHYQSRYFICSSENNNSSDMKHLRSIIEALISSLFHGVYDSVAYEKYSWDLILFLLTSFSNNDLSGQPLSRHEEINAYIHANAYGELSLEETARHFGLTPQYFARCFKKEFGTSFLKYLNEIRLENAERLLRESSATVLRIALQCGFPNASSFVHSFHEKYGMNPVDYRHTFQSADQEKTLSSEEIKSLLHPAEEKTPEAVREVNIDLSKHQEPLKKPWSEFLNLGSISTSTSSDFFHQAHSLQENMHFHTARIILDRRDLHSESFYEESRCLEFLLGEGMRPWFVIDFRQYADDASFPPWLSRFLNYVQIRYGLRQCNLEIAYDSDFSSDKPKKYADFLRTIRRTLAKSGIECRIAGPALLLNENGENLKRFLAVNKDLDQITIRVAPYTIGERNGSVFLNRISGRGWMKDQYSMAASLIKDAGLSSKPLIVSWRNFPDDFEALNDTSYQAASIVQAQLEGYGFVDALPLENPLDGMRGEKSEKIFTGQSGLICVSGIRKPSFYALRFLTNLDSVCCYQNDSMLISSDGGEYYQIVLHNCSTLSYKYYLNDPPLVPGHKIPEDFYAEHHPVHLSLHLYPVHDGTYFLKTRIVNEKTGNAFHQWLSMNYSDPSFLGKDEFNFLQSSGLPQMHGEFVTAVNNALTIEFTLEPNEIRHLHLIKTS